jgi:serine/threonine protein phosphatase PrpC
MRQTSRRSSGRATAAALTTRTTTCASGTKRRADERASALKKGPVILDETPPPATIEVSVPSERAVAIAGKSAPVVILPAMRSRLDSHTEIRDDGAGLAQSSAEHALPVEGAVQVVTHKPESVPPPSGVQLSLISAIGRSEPAQGPTERSAIVDRHRLFILADGFGQRVQHELVSAVVVDALAAAFEADADDTFPADASLPRRADRLRRSMLVADAILRERGQTDGLEVSRTAILAAHFAPDNRSLYVATSGPDRAYRLRGHDVTQLNKPSLAAVATDGARAIEIVLADTAPDDVYVFGTDAAFLALGDELRSVLTFDASIDRVAAHFVAAATRDGKSTGMTAIVVRVEPPRLSQRPTMMG